MSETDGKASVVSSMAARLRGNGKPEEGNHMRTEEDEGQVARLAKTEASQANHQLPSNAHQAAAIRPSWGSNASLPIVEVERAVLQRVQERAAVAGKRDVPADIVDFKDRANVIFLDQNNQRVSFVRVVVAWED